MHQFSGWVKKMFLGEFENYVQGVSLAYALETSTLTKGD